MLTRVDLLPSTGYADLHCAKVPPGHLLLEVNREELTDTHYLHRRHHNEVAVGQPTVGNLHTERCLQSGLIEGLLQLGIHHRTVVFEEVHETPVGETATTQTS